MCMFCGLYLWSLTHTLCKSNNDKSISLLSFWFRGFIHRMFMLEVKTKKIILNGMIHISVFSPHVLYI
ncbi:hypothetical protein AtNW77_Chr3g0181661 [Arabidopsis thaliana]|uniref:At3g22415 n=3 Tax=Arabidopsis TaxID=3701 RepID=Q3EB24_ARATH|nr:uncharacterized protein AT3G22415 [Arabidopsis thaliana]KAG7626195.1 hypothetical protein ISN45_At03g023580 [Arabidopsis thaliana x Arabidopsis arenosa]ABJ17135.1 At3g22415 [Arabidopsis thaliana]AEE76632.1 hypothetical protein AT3G22415 [Arabidopsis thaliana]CAA0383318.1 unnamed protein product [Arabidopsis thaliana]VYS58242.1 unnamed protein product [Arabidopsis thaliana]|eukprot:NP_974353.1 hypothetical protein AT3G22415 [Arabidopsis thaliana]